MDPFVGLRLRRACRGLTERPDDGAPGELDLEGVELVTIEQSRFGTTRLMEVGLELLLLIAGAGVRADCWVDLHHGTDHRRREPSGCPGPNEGAATDKPRTRTQWL